MQNTVSLWQSIAKILTSSDAGQGLVRSHPPSDKRLSLLEALRDSEVAANREQLESGTRSYSELNKILRQLSIFEHFSRCPILGISGLLNSGKSSLLATYLSPEGRRRVLIGLSNLSGTHRFILWLPTRWRDQQELMETLMSFLEQLFGHPPEALSDDPKLAARQYNGQLLSSSSPTAQPLSVPLIAYDTALDDLRLGLLDCPDIQTGFWSSEQAGGEMSRFRQQQLSSVGRLCSAFVVLTKLNSLHDHSLIEVLCTLRDAMPGVPRILAVNRVKARYSPEIVASEAQSLIDRFGIRSLFMAYDFRSSLAQAHIPSPPEGLVAEEEGDPQPIFFEVKSGSAAEDQHRSDAKHSQQAPVSYLYHLGQQLDPGTLADESCRSLALQLKSRSLEAIEWHGRNPEIRKQQISDARSAIAQACYDFLAQRDSSGAIVGLRLQVSPTIVSQMSASLNRTAPAWLRPSLAIDRSARQIQQAVSGKLEKFRLFQNASKSVVDFAKRFRRGEGAQVMTPERLSRAIRDTDRHDALQSMTDVDLLEGCQLALERFAAEEQTQFDEAMLDKWSQAVWKQMELKDKLRRGLQPLALTAGPLLAALLVPFDGGGTAVLVFASAQELLAAAGITAVLTTAAGGGETLKIIQEETPWRQMSDLFAIACDSLGLPRAQGDQLPKCGAHVKAVYESRLPVRLQVTHSCLSLWQPEQGVFGHLQTVIDRLQ